MATELRNTDPLAATIAANHNALKKQIGAGASVHLDACERSIASANATNLATSITLANEMRSVIVFHFADAGTGMAHLVADTTNAMVLGYVSPQTGVLADVMALANQMKSKYNAHRSQAGVHHNADAGNAVSSADATDQTSLNTLLNEMKGDINAHIILAPTNVAPSMRLVSP